MPKGICARHLTPLILGLCFMLTTGLAQVQAWGQDNSATTIKGAFPCSLVKSIDSKKAKEGDPVVCQTASPLRDQYGKLIPSGTKMLGHVTQAKARSKGDSESSLAITFDKIELSKGNEIPMKGTLQAIGPGLSGGPDTGPATEPGLHGGASVQTQSTTLGKEGGTHAAASGPLNSDSKGSNVKGVDLGDNSVLTSSGKELKLDNGTQMVVRAE